MSKRERWEEERQGWRPPPSREEWKVEPGSWEEWDEDAEDFDLSWDEDSGGSGEDEEE